MKRDGHQHPRDLVQRAREVVRQSEEVREAARRSRDARGGPSTGRTDTACAPGDCASAHAQLQRAMDVLDRAFRGAEFRERRTRLIDHGTAACAHARLNETREMCADLQAMLTDALALPLDGPEGQETLRLRRLIRTALSQPPEDDGEH